MDQLIQKVENYVKDFMAKFDASHDFSHIHRVVGLAKLIERQERNINPSVRYRSDVIVLGALFHDIGDHKYLSGGEDGLKMAENVLLGLGADLELAKEVQIIVNHVSYSTEIKDPNKVQELITEHPELAIVQDADRLEALGAHGMARCFAYNAVKNENGNLYTAIAHFPEKLEKLEGIMKTETGRQMAGPRTKRLRLFRGWWEEEKVENEELFEPRA